MEGSVSEWGEDDGWEAEADKQVERQSVIRLDKHEQKRR
jgi:hypothetical protein